MTRDPDHYDLLYSGVADAFGNEADALLLAHAGLLNPALPVLDIGAGQGRNALFLARRGLAVHAVDPSQVAVDQLSELARSEGLSSLSAATAGFETYEPAVERFGAVLLFGLLQILTREQIDLLRARVGAWTGSGSLLFVTSSTKNDPGFGISERRHTKSVVKTHLEPGELPRLFAGWSEVFFEEDWGPKHDHGDGKRHRHHLAQAVLVRS